jgi:hypothetical protein
MDLQHIVKESELYRHVGRLGFPLECAGQSWRRQLLTGFTNDPAILESRARRVKTLAEYPKLVEDSYKKLQALKEDEQLLLNYKPSDTSKTAEEQIFLQESTQHR